jgi:glutathione S-transferase
MGTDRPAPFAGCSSGEGIVIYWSSGSCARVTLIALEEIGVSCEHRAVRRGDAAAMSEHAQSVNPKGNVPALVVDDRVLTETPAIQIYLHRRFPEARLLTEDPDGALVHKALNQDPPA